MAAEWLRRLRRGSHAEQPAGTQGTGPGPPPAALSYRRPKFLRGGTEDSPRDRRGVRGTGPERPLPWGTGYAEVINAEKSEFNEDQAACCQITIRRREPGLEEDEEWLILCSTQFLTGYYWALFDGHGGPEAAIIASNYLHYCIKQKLEEVVGGITEAQPPMHLSGRCVCDSDPQFVEEKHIHAQDLVVGALENAFQECDEVIGQEMEATNQTGGCTALAALYFQGKLYVANAGDSRAVLILKDNIVPMSCEFTPETERQRIQHLAFLFPKLLGGEFTRFEFPRRLKGDDVGQKVLYRDYFMEGWGYKTVEKADLKYPLVHGHGKQERLRKGTCRGKEKTGRDNDCTHPVSGVEQKACHLSQHYNPHATFARRKGSPSVFFLTTPNREQDATISFLRLAYWGLWLSLEVWGITSSKSLTPTLKSNLSSPASRR
ncbi:protein phosphatase 1M isoform X2 [Melopsittacus undulatus]|uniref:protein phosphatase 1M isoform X2 n=1 Tax=Melopsittacus undulatus TaxID=13146 RepID=UPI00146CCD65|nr:protein phosphatase 1M isoform X2 [Melopsittacus undulatus]